MFSDPREQRWNEAAAALAPWRFRAERCPADALASFLPLRAHDAPDTALVRATGEVEDHPLQLVEYESTYTDSEGATSTSVTLLAILEHPHARGSVAIVPDMRHFSGFAAALDVLFWIPPFTFVKAFQALDAALRPEVQVGNPEVDRRYYLYAASEEAARTAITPGLADYLLKYQFQGRLEVREGLVLFALRSTCFDAAGAIATVQHAVALARCFLPAASAAYR